MSVDMSITILNIATLAIFVLFYVLYRFTKATNSQSKWRLWICRIFFIVGVVSLVVISIFIGETPYTLGLFFLAVFTSPTLIIIVAILFATVKHPTRDELNKLHDEIKSLRTELIGSPREK